MTTRGDVQIDTDVYIRDFVDQNCIKIMRDVEKFEPLTDDFTHFQMVQKTMNTHTQYMSANIPLSTQEKLLPVKHRHVDTTISNTILKKGTRGSFHLWDKDTERPRGNVSQCCYANSFLGIGRIFTPGSRSLML